MNYYFIVTLSPRRTSSAAPPFQPVEKVLKTGFMKMELLIPSIGQRYSSMFRTFMDGFPASATYPGYFLWLAQEKVSEFIIIKIFQELIHTGVAPFSRFGRAEPDFLSVIQRLHARQIAASTPPMT